MGTGLKPKEQDVLRNLIIAHGEDEGDRAIAKRFKKLKIRRDGRGRSQRLVQVSHTTVNRYRHQVNAMVESIIKFKQGERDLQGNRELQDQLDEDALALRKALFDRFVEIVDDEPPTPPKRKAGRAALAKYQRELLAWQDKHDCDLITWSREFSGNVRLRSEISRTLVQYNNYIDARDQRDQSVGKNAGVGMYEIIQRLLPLLCDDCKDAALTMEEAKREKGAAVDVKGREVG